MRKMTAARYAVFVTTFLSFFNFAFAQDNLHIGNLEIHPLFSLEQKYDDNIFLEPHGSNDPDWITIGTAGFGLKMPFVPGREEDMMLKAKYYADVLSFYHHKGQDRVDHTASLTAECKFSNDSWLKVEDNFRKTADPPNNELTALQKRSHNRARAAMGYSGEKINFDFGYENIRDAYNNLKNLNRYEQVFTPTFSYQLFPKTSVFGEYNYGRITYDSSTTNNGSHYNQYRLGVKGDIAAKLTGTAKFGYRQTSYEGNKKDFKGFAAFIDVAYLLKERTTLNAFAERTSEESSYLTNSHYQLNRIGFRLTHELLTDTYLIGGGYYELNRYPDVTTQGSVTARRRDHIFDVTIGVRHEIKEWVNWEVSYEYKKRDSRFSTFDYRDNKVTAKINFLF